VRVLLDECVPRRLRRDFPNLDVSTVADEGWRGRRNGDLLQALREAGFTHLITVDRNLAFQQNLPAAGVGVVVVHAPTNRISDLHTLVPAIVAVLPSAGPGQVVHVGV
jgi:hypothetical protein